MSEMDHREKELLADLDGADVGGQHVQQAAVVVVDVRIENIDTEFVRNYG